jgi:hypothetical protein|tara:strand:+ start:174 stop:1019 length:846 start_codon:yes stop_codon:yes gene_type:complete
MIGFDHLGNLGRLGNQMFEFAALRGIAAHHGYDVCIPPAEHEGIENYSLHDCFKLDHIPTRFIATERYAQEPHFHFSKELFEGCPDNVSLYGFFQTEKYFVNAADIVRKDFTFHDSILQPCVDFMSQYADQEPIMLHVRRGDPNLTDPRGFKWSYTQCSHQHPPQTLEYYEEALSHFDKDQPVIVFSDSPDWVQEQEFFGGDRFVISVPEDKYSDGSYEPYIDLCLMSLCSHAIIANSSLSWWGAWLQNGKGKVVAPKRWYGPAYADKDLSDLYCKDWIVV